MDNPLDDAVTRFARTSGKLLRDLDIDHGPRLLRDVHLLDLPDANGFIGYVKGEALAAFVADPDSDSPRHDTRLFVENVRDHLGYEHNIGALALRETLEAGEQDQVILRNNGVVIVAHGADIVNTTLTLSAPQIVNGAQTSITLFDQRGSGTLDGVWVPLKVVVSCDAQLRTGVVRGANTQENIGPYDFLALEPFLKRLQTHMLQESLPADQTVALRRRHKAPLTPGLAMQRHVSPKDILQAFVCGPLGEPASAQARLAIWLTRVPRYIFSAEHAPEPYHLLAWLVFHLRHETADKSFWEGPRKSFPAFSHLLYVYWKLLDDWDMLPRSVKGGWIVGEHADAQIRYRRVISQIRGTSGVDWAREAMRIVREVADTNAVDLSAQTTRTRALTEQIDAYLSLLRRSR